MPHSTAVIDDNVRNITFKAMEILVCKIDLKFKFKLSQNCFTYFTKKNHV